METSDKLLIDLHLLPVSAIIMDKSQLSAADFMPSVLLETTSVLEINSDAVDVE